MADVSNITNNCSVSAERPTQRHPPSKSTVWRLAAHSILISEEGLVGT
jgi:hypothetical protein